MAKIRVTSYMKNVAKSFGYALGDVFSEYNPVIKSIASESKDAAEELYGSIKSFAFKKSSTGENAFKKGAKDTIGDLWKNTKEDLKSGNWYNKQRKEAAENDMMKAMGLDFGDLNFDEDWGDFDEETSTKAEIASEQRSAAQIVAGVDEVGSKIATSVSAATVESADYIVASQTKSSRALYSLNERGFGSVNRSIGALNDTIASFAQIAQPLSAHMQNSSIFYTNTTKTLNEMNQSIHQLVKNTTPAPTASQGKSRSAKGTFSSLFSSDTGISISYYKDMIKENFGEYKDLADMALGALKGMKSEDGSYGKNFSPMQFATTMMTKALLPKVFKESMKNFNESIKYAMSGLVLKAKDKSGNPVFEILKDLILPKDGYKSQINTANYNKGQVAWDGIARKALVEVIPTTLLKIYSAITGRPEERYDYDRGKFITVKNIEKEIKKEKEKYAQEAGGDFRKDALKSIENNASLNDAQKAQLNKEIENYFYKAFATGSGFADLKGKDFKKEKFGLSDDSLLVLQELIDGYRASGDKDKRNRHNKFITDTQLTRDKYGNMMRDREATGDNIMAHLNNGSLGFDKDGNVIGVDEYDHSMNFYLRGIYQYTGFLADNIGFIGGKSGKIKKRGAVKKGGDIQNINTSTETKRGEKTKDEARSSGSVSFDNPFVDEDEQRAKEHEENIENAKKEAKGKFKFITDKVRSLFKGDGLGGAYNKPFESVSFFLNKVGLSLDKLIWGEDEDSEKGIFGFLMAKTKKLYSQFTNWMEEKFHVKEKWEKLKDKMFGEKGEDGKRHGGFAGKVNEFKDETFKTFKNMGSSMGKTVKQFFSKGGDKSVPTAAHGRKVTKSGIVVVSEGELIVPSELNPYYHGVTNKASQIANENRIANKFYGMFAKGGTPIPPDQQSDLDKVGDYRQIKIRVLDSVLKLIGADPIINKRGKEYKRIVAERQAEQTSSPTTTTEDSSQEKGSKTKKRKEFKSKVNENAGAGYKFLKDGFDRISEGAKNLFSNLFGKGDKKQADKEKKIIGGLAQKLMKEAGQNKGAVGVGALIGGGVGLMTGTVVGPILGAAVGAAVGLTAKSEKVQKVLFGEVDENGDRKGGLLGKKISNFMTKNVPSMAKGAGLGAAAGMFLGSPVLGAVVGAAAGYVKSSEKAKEMIFGKLVDDGKGGKKREGMPKEMKAKLKRYAPTLGAAAMALTGLGPFGLVGNILLGGSMGYLATTDKLQKYLFGDPDKEGDKGLAGMIKEKIFDNLNMIFRNMGHAIVGWGKRLIDVSTKSVTNFFSNFFNKRKTAFEDGEGGFFNTLIGGTLSIGGKVVKGATNAVGGALGEIARQTAVGNLKHGYRVYDKKLGRNLNAAERVKARGDNAFGTFANLDRTIAVMDEKDLQDLAKKLQDAKNPTPEYNRKVNEIIVKLESALDGIDKKTGRAIIKALEKGDEDKAIDLVNESGLTNKESALKAVREAAKLFAEARNAKNNSQQILKDLQAKGIKLGSGSIGTAIDRINDEIKEKTLTPEEKEKKEVATWRNKLFDVVERISNLLSGDEDGSNNEAGEDGELPQGAASGAAVLMRNAKGKNQKYVSEEVLKTLENGDDLVCRTYADGSKRYFTRPQGGKLKRIDDDKAKELLKEGSEADLDKVGDYGYEGDPDEDNSGHRVDVKSKIKNAFSKFFGKKGSDGNDEESSEDEPETKTVFDMAGNPVQMIKNNQGEWEKDMRDSETRDSHDAMNSMFTGLKSVGGIGAAIGGIGGIFKSFGEKLFGKKEEGGGFFNKLLGLFTNTDGDGIFSQMLNFFTGGKTSNGTMLKGVFTNIVGPALLAGGFAGLYDDFFHKTTGGAYGKGGDSNIYYDKETGKSVTKDTNGNYIDSDGNIIESGKGNVGVRDGDVASFSERLKENTVRGLVTGRKSVASTVIGKTNWGGKIGKAGNAVFKVMKEGADDPAVVKSFVQNITSAIAKITKGLAKVPALKGLAGSLDNMGAELAEQVSKKLATSSAKALANAASNAVVWIKIAYIIIDFTSGYDDARTTLGIVDEPTVGQRIISGLLRVFKNCIPIIGSLIPDSLVVNVFCKHVAPALGIEPEKLMKQREEAQETINAYNKEHGTDLNLQQYNKQVLKDYTWTERYGNAFKSTWQDTKDKFNNMKQGIKEKGFGGYMVDSVKSMGSDFINGYKEAGGGMAGIFKGVGSAFEKMLPGVFGEIHKKTNEIYSLAYKGKLGDLWKLTLDDFKGGETNEDGITTAVPSLFTKILGDAPLTGTKIVATPLALIFKLLQGVKNAFTGDGFFGKIIKGLDDLSGVSAALNYAKQGDIKGLWAHSNKDEDDNGFVGVMKAIPLTITKLSATPSTLLMAAGKGIANFFKKIIDKVKGTFNIIKEEKEYGDQLFKMPGTANITDFFKFKEEDPENPMGGFERALRVTGRVLSIGVALVKKVGHNIKEKFDSVVDTVKTSFNDLVSNGKTVFKSVLAGDVEGLWNLEIPDNPENPLGGIVRAASTVGKFLSLPLAAVSWVGHKIEDGFRSVISIAKTSFVDLASNEKTILKTALSGDVDGLWNLEINTNPDNPIGGVVKAISIASKFLKVPLAAVSWVGHKVEDGFRSVVNTVKTSFVDLATNQETISETAKSGDIQALMDLEFEVNPDNPLGGIVKGISTVSKFLNVPVAAVSWVGNKIKDGISSMVEKTKANNEAMTSSIEVLKGYAEDGDIKSIWKEKMELKDGDPLKPIWHVGFTINKLFQTVMALFSKLMKPIKKVVDKAKKWLGAFGVKIGQSTIDYIEEDEEAPSAGNSGIRRKNGGRFVSQFNSDYKDIKLGSSTVAEKGCGPAVATMLANDYGANVSMDKAINVARKYQDNNGTKATYFADILGNNGIETRPLAGKNIEKEVIGNLRQGNQVILLGQDSSNFSKTKSPFGPNNHYVLASGVDNNGNIIVRDPEGTGPMIYNKSILKNAKMGINANGSGSGSTYDTDIARKVWGYFTSEGYSPEATAGIMGNLYGESGMKPDRIQGDGKGPAAGIAQWENFNTKGGRWQKLSEFAKEKGYQWTDLDAQLQFINHELPQLDAYFNPTNDATRANHSKVGSEPTTFEAWRQSTDPMMAARQFEAAFERAGKPNMQNRLKATEEYYKLYHDSQYTGNYTASKPTGTSGEEKITFSNIISAIGNAFSTVLGNLFGNNKDESATDTTSGSLKTVPVDYNLIGDGNSKQKELAAKLLGIQGQISYDMNGARNPEKGSADCSSTVNWAYKKVTGVDVGNNTYEMLKSENTQIVDQDSSMNKTNGGSKSAGPNLANLKPGDILLYSRPTADYTSGRDYRVGHVEMYLGNNQRIGHPGPGQGPKITTMGTDSNRYIMAKRLKGIDNKDTNYNKATLKEKQMAGRGSGLLSSTNYGDIARMSGGSSGTLLTARPGTVVNGNSMTTISVPTKYRTANNISGGDSALVAKTTNMLNNLKSVATSGAKSGTISTDLVERLLAAIIKLLENINDNTSSVDKIYQVLSTYVQGKTSMDAAKVAAAVDQSNKSSSQNDEIDANIANLVGTLAAIAKG